MTEYNLGHVVGEKGPKGDTGPQGPKGPKGLKGEKGDKGENSFEIYSTGGALENEHRLFIQPNNLYVVGTQPSKGLWIQNTGLSGINGQFGYRDSTTKTIGDGFAGFSINEYHTVKFVRNGTSVTCYFDDDQKGSRTINFLDDYTDWNFYCHIWNNGTMKIQNIQIKPLQ